MNQSDDVRLPEILTLNAVKLKTRQEVWVPPQDREQGYLSTWLKEDRGRALRPILAEFREFLDGVHLEPPAIACISNVTGTWLGREAADTRYWIRHVQHTVRFAEGIREVMDDRRFVLLASRTAAWTAGDPQRFDFVPALIPRQRPTRRRTS